MAMLVCCPCGNPLDCDQLDLVVTLTCPSCQRELQLELENGNHRRFWSILTVMEGPYWIGEQFVMAVGEDLFLGRGLGNWLSLESEVLEARHCRLKLAQDGAVEISDLSSKSGTWVGDARISKGRLDPRDSFTIGEYRFRLDHRASLGTEFVSGETLSSARRQPLPTMVSVQAERGHYLVRNRFSVARLMIMTFAWLAAVYHASLPRALSDNLTEWYWAVIAGLVTVIPLLASGRRVTLIHRYFRHLAVMLLFLMTAVHVFLLSQPMPAMAALLLAASLCLITFRTPTMPVAIVFAIAGGVANLTMAVLAANGISTLLRGPF